MKKTNTFLLSILVFITFQIGNAQKFLTEVFDEVEVTSNVIYGVNATVIAFSQLGEAVPQPLTMDVYEPVGDEADERPLALVFHTGNFLPPEINGGIAGTKVDSNVVEICTRLAKHGYTAASVEYRLGWNPLAETQPQRALGLIQAAYRGIQDGRTCIRYFRKDYTEAGNQFKVDTSRITAFGVGTGGYLVLGMVGLTEYTEIITTTNGPGKFLLSAEPLIPMVVEAYHGDVEGKNLTVTPDDAFGLPAGDTTNYVNHPNYSSDFHLCANVGGAIGDISWLEAGDQPIISMQSAYDQFAPYDDATLVVPTTGDPIVRVQGALAIAMKQNELGNHQEFIDANISDVYTDAAIHHSALSIQGHDYMEALFPVTNPLNAFGFDEGVVTNWWNATDLSPISGIAWGELPHSLDPENLTYHSQGQILNVGMGPEKAKANIDTIMGYFAPRAYITLSLEDLVATETIRPEEVNLRVAPNPVADQFMLTSAEETPMQRISIYDINGKLVRRYDSVNYHYFYIPRGDMPAGTYIVNVDFKKGHTSRKLILK